MCQRTVKTSLAPGSKVVTRYLDDAGLTPYLDQLGFTLVGYGCTHVSVTLDRCLLKSKKRFLLTI